MPLDVEKMAIVEIVAEMLSLEGVRNSRKIDSRMEELCDWLNLSSYRECLALICSGAVKWGKALNGFFYVVPSEDRYERSDFRAVMDGFIERSNQYAARQQAIALAAGESLDSDVYGVGIVGASLGAGEAAPRSADSSGQPAYAIPGFSDSEINLAIERLVTPSAGAADIMRCLVIGESYTRTVEPVTRNPVPVVSEDNLARVNRHSRGGGFRPMGFSQGYREAAERARQIVSSTKPIACDGCTNYHGQSYGGNRLVCAIHPTGVDGASCGDWEGKPEALRS